MTTTGFIKVWDDYIKWKEYFMSLAVLASKRSKDPDFRVGACIVNDEKQIVGIGYNGHPIIPKKENETKIDNDKIFPWLKKEALENKHLYVCHAELNAIAHKTSTDVKGCTMYVTLFPCNECAKLIAQAKLKKVVYLSDEKRDKIEFQAGRRILETVGVELEQYIPSKPIEIDMAKMLKQAESKKSNK